VELRSPEEIAEAATSSVALEVAETDAGSEAPPGDIEMPKVEKPSEAEELEKFIAVRDALYKKAKEWDAKIRDFETAIRRPYFHVKPLDDMQLGNWHRYLEKVRHLHCSV
jgi:pre-mRNA-processing factor 39